MARRRFQRGTLFLRGKRDKVWVGRWREDVVEDGQVKRVLKSEVLGGLDLYPTKRLAQRALEDRLNEVNGLDYKPKQLFTLEQFAERYRETILPQFRPATQAVVGGQLKSRILPVLGKWQLTDLTTEVLQRYMAQQTDSVSTIKLRLNILRMLWSTAKAWGYVKHDPFAGLIMPRRQLVVNPVFTLDQMKQIIDEAEEPYKTLFWIAAETGMRIGELLGLQVRDFDLDEGCVHVQRSVFRRKVQLPKTRNAERRAALSTPLLLHLREFFTQDWVKNPEGFLFLTKQGKVWYYQYFLEAVLYPLLDKCGIPRCGMHAFRRANCTLMDRVGTPIKVRQQRVGHAEVATTLAYTVPMGADDRVVAEKLNGILFPTVPNLPVASGASA